MLLKEFDYNLPEELIAQTPVYPRDHSRLMIIDKNNGNIDHKHFYDLLDFLGENDVLVLNKTRVINARLKGFIDNNNNKKQVEIFLHKQLSENTWDCLVYPGKKLKPGVTVSINDDKNNISLNATIKDISLKGRIVEFDKKGIEFLKTIEQIGELPLPPYIKEKLEDKERYQTIWSEINGSVAAPTASLHFTQDLIDKLIKKGVKIEKVLLHVGLGTFMGVETENIQEHKMHSEYIELEEDVANRLNNYKKNGKNIIAVGTTAIRVLESFCDKNQILSSGQKDTDIFIYPSYNWKFVNGIITNFHLPKSTLLMLVSSFAGSDNIKKAYSEAIKNKYRFFSFGDAMFIK